MQERVNLSQIAKEICEREVSEGREVNITEVKRVIRHLADMIAEEWVKSYDLRISEAIRKNGMGRIKKKSV